METIKVEFKGLEELINKLEIVASEAEVKAVNKKMYQECADATQPVMQSHMPRSSNNAKSGKKGYRPPGHAKDNIPKKVTASKAVVGWELNGDAENWFYMKFVEWGTSKMPPRDFIDNTMSEMDGKYSSIADRTYQTALNEVLG